MKGSLKKLVIFRLFQALRDMRLNKLLLVVLLPVFGIQLNAQEVDDKALKQSNELIYQGNDLVEEDFITAEKEYRKAISKVPNNAVGSYNLGHAYFKSGHLDESLYRHAEAATNASDKKERHAAFHNMGNILMQKEKCKEAVEAYKNALRNDPSDDETRYNLALAKECAKQQGQGDGQDENSDNKNEDENKQSENKNNENQQDQDQNQDQQEDEGDDKQDQNEGEDKEDDQGKPSDEKDNKDQNQPGDQKKEQKQPQPGKLSPQQVKNLLEAMNNQEKKVQDKMNARKTKGVKVKTDKDW